MKLYNYKKLHSLTFYIELSSKFVGVGLNLVLLKDNKGADHRFFFFFLKCRMIVHEIRFSMSDLLIYNLL